MNRKLKIIIGCAVTICLTIGMVNYIGHRLDPDFTERAMDAVKAFHTLEDDSLEVIIYGSSHAWKGCDSMEMYKEYGLAAYNYGCNWQAINTTLLFLQDSLRTQTPKVVCIDTYRVGTIKKDTNMDGEIYYTRAMSNFKCKSEYLKQCFGSDMGRYASYYMPLIMFHNNWNQIDSENFSISNPEGWITSMGYSGTAEIKPVSIGNYLEFPQKQISEGSVEILDKMVEACEAKGVQVVFYTCPYQGEYAYYVAMEQYANEHNCVYLNLFEYMETMGMNPETDFRDAGHLNDSGSVKVADFLSKYIVNNYDVTDMRTIEGNIWKQNLQ